MTKAYIGKGTIGIALAALVLLALALSPVSARAADLGGEGFEYFDEVYNTPSSGGYEYFDEVYNTNTPGGYEYFDEVYNTPSYGGGGYTPSYGYTSGGYRPMGYTQGYSYSSPSYYSAPSYGGSQSQSQSQSQYSSNTNIVNVNVRAQQTPVYNPPVYDICSNIRNVQSTVPVGYYLQNGYCYQYTYNYPTTPYVSLSQVPYTGLELGPVGTAAYWSFLVLWCLVAAYLVAVKRVQVGIFHKLNSFLFGEHETPTQVAFAGVRVSAERSAPTPKTAAADEFVFSQINRSRN